jgi:hypothetical protein
MAFMDIKDLNKSQLILLAVLLSFVTSIATGITTVTLMQQAPSSITTPVTRLVKQTIEKIEQVEGKTTVQTVVIKEEDLVVDAIEINKSAIFEVSKEGLSAEGQIAEIVVGRGFAVSSAGMVVVDSSAVISSGATYFLKNAGGKFKAKIIPSGDTAFTFLKIGASLEPEGGKAVFSVPTSGDLSSMKVGQRVLVLGKNISSFIFEGKDNIKTSSAGLNTGSLVINLDGEALGMALSSETKPFVAIGDINTALKALVDQDKLPQ